MGTISYSLGCPCSTLTAIELSDDQALEIKAPKDLLVSGLCHAVAASDAVVWTARSIPFAAPTTTTPAVHHHGMKRRVRLTAGVEASSTYAQRKGPTAHATAPPRPTPSTLYGIQ